MPNDARITTPAQWPPQGEQRRAQARHEAEFCLALGRVLFPAAHHVIPRQLVPLWNAAQRVLRSGADCDGHYLN